MNAIFLKDKGWNLEDLILNSAVEFYTIVKEQTLSLTSPLKHAVHFHLTD